MASPSSNPFYGSGAGSSPANSGYQRMALDNLIRRELKVSDPNDPQQVANALLERFKEDPRAKAIGQEARGLPFLLSAPANGASLVQAATSSDAELQQAKDDVNRDLQELLSNSLLKDVTPEIQGWAQAVRTAIAEGTTAARFALDPRQRDKAFAIRRQLGDYARVARLIGALTPTLSMTYRKFAQSLDEVAAILLVLMGEALSNVGFNGGRFLLQAPYAELQVRRDAAIYALRNLVGATQQAYGPNDWPRGLDAYRSLFRVLEEQGQADLRSLLLENELSRIMDELIQRSAHGTADGLRALGSTAQIDLERFRRLVFIGQHVVSPESPPLTAFLEAIQLFADAFDTSGGFRLMRISRPPILFYGLYGMTVMEEADQRLLQLIIERGLLADKLDCFLQCDCTPTNVKCQVILDKILYDVDRAIDLYALGKDDFGQPERRASAYSFVIEHFKEMQKAPEDNCGLYESRDNQWGPADAKGIAVTLQNIVDQLRPSLELDNVIVKNAVDDLREFAGQVRTVLTAPPNRCTVTSGGSSSDLCAAITTADTSLSADPNPDITDLLLLYKAVQDALIHLASFRITLEMPRSIEDFLGILQRELCIQADMENRWENLVRSMAPNCAGLSEVFNAIGQVIDGAIGLVGVVECPEFSPSIPPHFETSLDSIVDDVDRMGRGRPKLEQSFAAAGPIRFGRLIRG